ncbi:MAG: hypothetical protein N3A59_04420 [Thermodesulfovibrionales bacterium]|nr:hypothetical protein [Thermodesulfovibrionales bacterium]
MKNLKNTHFYNLSILITALLLFISLSFTIRELIVYHYKSSKKFPPVLRTETQTQLNTNINDYEDIVKNNIFGLPESSLKLLSIFENQRTSISEIKLIGTISGNSKYSYAIFLDKNNSQEIIKEGQKVLDYGTLKRVYKDKVIIHNGAETFEIPLQDIFSVEEISTSKHPYSTSSFVRGLTSSTYMLDKKKVIQAIDNPNELMTDARLQPNFIDGRQEGFILKEVKNNGIYHNLGLQNGDILLRINEYNIANPETALQAFYSLRGLDRIQLDIIRNGNRMTLTYLVK